MIGFEDFQLAHEFVEIEVVDLRRVQHVVKMLVVAYLFAQCVDSIRLVAVFGHLEDYRN